MHSWPCSPNVPILLHHTATQLCDNTQTSRRGTHSFGLQWSAYFTRAGLSANSASYASTWRPGRLWSEAASLQASSSRCAGPEGRGRRSPVGCASLLQFASHALVTCQVHRKMGRPGNTACDSFDAVRPRVHECQDRVKDAHIWLVCQNPALQRQ
jgi:hypothetical protein